MTQTRNTIRSTRSKTTKKASDSAPSTSPKTRSAGQSRWLWASGQRTTRQERVPGVVSDSFSLSGLVKSQLLKPVLLEEFQASTGLSDYAWRAVYYTGDDDAPITLEERLDRAKGFVIFMHGWDGCNEIWENMPAMVCRRNPRLVCFTLDVNGFGNSPFIEPVPTLEQCSPAASMRAVERWAAIVQLKTDRARVRRVPFLFVGHSMSGASLFYKSDADGWENERYGLLALAPALLKGDILRKGFYKTLGLGIMAGTGQAPFDWLKIKLSPRLIEPLIGGASAANKKVQLDIFARTPNGTLAQTFYAMGLAEENPQRANWDNFRIILGHSDRLVGLGPMLNLLEELGLRSTNIRVVLGDHYFFSVGRESAQVHGQNRTIVLKEIFKLLEAVSEQRPRSK
jgi:pimeloyl-ACP methyl ester carboxylesterase